MGTGSTAMIAARRLVSTAVVLLAAAVPSTATAHELAPPQAGDRVRLIVYDERALVGRLVAFDPHGLHLQADGDSACRVLPRASIAGLEVLRLRTRIRLAAPLGFLAGGIVGIAIERARGAVFGGLAGAVCGGLLGTTSRRERWEEAPLP
jgi:hypothetical protein